MGILTISASYGAGGSEIAPIMAKELGLPFVDRAVPASVARELGVPVEGGQNGGARLSERRAVRIATE
jgi:cytidylate kinase